MPRTSSRATGRRHRALRGHDRHPDPGQPDRHRRHRRKSAGQRHRHPDRRRVVEQHDRRHRLGRRQYDRLLRGHRRRRRRHGRGRQRDPAQFDLLQHGAGHRPGRRRRDLEQLGAAHRAQSYENFPVITAVVERGGTTTVSGTFNSTPSTTFALDFYTLSSIECLGLRRGAVRAGLGVGHDRRSGNATFSFSFPTLPAAPSSSRRRPRTRTATRRSSRRSSASTSADGPDRLHARLTVNVGVAGHVRRHGIVEPRGRPALVHLDVRRRRDGDGRRSDPHLRQPGTDTVT